MVLVKWPTVHGKGILSIKVMTVCEWSNYPSGAILIHTNAKANFMNNPLYVWDTANFTVCMVKSLD